MTNKSTENDPRKEYIKFDYEQSLEIFKNLADIRFKLLALVPLVSGTGVAFLSTDPAEAPLPVIWAGGLFGLFITLGVIIYDHRNTQFMYMASYRARELEKELPLVFEGYFAQWPKKERFIGVSIGANNALALIYATAVAAWVFIVARTTLAFIWRPADVLAMAVASLTAVLLCRYLMRLDEKLKNSAKESCSGGLMTPRSEAM